MTARPTFSFADRGAARVTDRAEKEAKAVAWIDRAERFSGGFDLGVVPAATSPRSASWSRRRALARA
jgi:hypothetical protein